MAREQLEVLKALDKAKTQWYYFTAIVISGMGFFTDAYDLFCISLVTKLLGRIYCHVHGAEKPGTLPPSVSAVMNGVALCGALAGQLFFGWLGDKMGRKRVYGMTLMIMVICSFASGLSFSNEPKAAMATLGFFRFWLGCISGLFTKKFLHRHGLHLLGTTSTWFLLDIAYYSQNLFQKDIFSAIGWIQSKQMPRNKETGYRAP